MASRKRKSPGRKKRETLRARDVQGSKFVVQILDLLRPLRAHCDDPKRLLHYDELCAWLLLYFFTPVLDSMRGLQQASDIPAVRRKLKLSRFSLGSFSEAMHVFDPKLLTPIIEEIAARLGDVEPDVRLQASGLRPTAVDGTLVRALPSMVWALWLDEEHRAAKMHLQFDLLKGAPARAEVTHGNAGEAEVLRRSLEPGRLYVTDRGYFSYALMADILKADSSFVDRAHSNFSYETLEERTVEESARRSGVEADLVVRPKCPRAQKTLGRALRLVRIHVPDDGSRRRAPRRDAKTKMVRTTSGSHTLLLLTDRMDLDPHLIGILYSYRWQVELFFRWFKKILHADRLLSLNEGGLTIAMYCALIASMLITLWTGRKPTKRTFEMLCFLFMGMADEADLARHLERLEKNQ